MIALVAAWIAVVAVVLILATRPWSVLAARAPLPVILSVIMATFVIWPGRQTYADLMAQGMWTASTMVIPFVPIKAALYALLGHALGRIIITTRNSSNFDQQRMAIGGGLAVLCLYLVVTDIVSIRQEAYIRSARSTVLSPDETSKVITRIRNGEASADERNAFLENPNCPLEMIEEYATGDQGAKIAVARNKITPANVLVELSRDVDEQVRVQAAYNENLPVTELPRLSADSYAWVRQTVAWKEALPDEDFRRLITDPDPDVRATVAVQPRLEDEDLRKLATDADAKVSRDALRMMGTRGLE